MSDNGLMMEYFEWNLPDDGSLWKAVADDAAKLKTAGVTAVWLPPAYKGAAGSEDTGYSVYDLYDLGEFKQKGTVRTKYGTKKEYLDAIKALQAKGINVYAENDRRLDQVHLPGKKRKIFEVHLELEAFRRY